MFSVHHEDIHSFVTFAPKNPKGHNTFIKVKVKPEELDLDCFENIFEAKKSEET